MRGRILLMVLLAAAGAPGAGADGAPPGAVPFPVDHDTTVHASDGPVFTIDGPTVIPAGIEVGVERDVKIVGINGASLDVQGGLKVRGTQDHWVEIRNVDFSPTREPRLGLHLDMVDFYGCRFVHQQGEGLKGQVTIENSSMQRDCVFDVRVRGGFLKIMTVDSGIPWTIRADPPADAPRKPIQIEIRSSWAREVRCAGPAEMIVRHSEVRAGLTFEHVTDLTVDGCDVTRALTIRQGPEDSFKKVTLTKCNLFDGCTLDLERTPPPDGKVERVKVDKFYFGPREAGEGVTDAKGVAKLVTDGKDDAARKVRAQMIRPQDRKHDLVAYGTLRLRVPKVR